MTDQSKSMGVMLIGNAIKHEALRNNQSFLLKYEVGTYAPKFMPPLPDKDLKFQAGALLESGIVLVCGGYKTGRETYGLNTTDLVIQVNEIWFKLSSI